MKVLCIDGSSCENPTVIPPKEGEDYVVIEDIEILTDYHGKQTFYRLQEMPESLYLTKRFVPLNGPDETERIDEIVEKISLGILTPINNQ